MTDQAPESQATRVSETRARQGFRDRPVLLVLAASLALAVLALIGLWFMRSGEFQNADADAGLDARDTATMTQTVQPAKGD